ncbi:MAG: PfkB family carbohydrate kinase [Chloroflexota bacterium]
MPDRPRICVAGSLHFDIMVRAPYLPRLGETLMGEAWWWKQGGKGGNQAVAAARHGAAVTMIGALGPDEFGDRLRERMTAAGVDLSAVATVERGSGMSVAILQDDGDYAAVVVSGANRTIDPDAVVAAGDAIRASRALLLQHEIGEAANAAAARVARDAGVPVILNAAPARPLGELAGLVDVLVVNTVEAEMLGAGPVVDLASAGAAAHALLGAAPTVIVTAGSAGVATATVDGATDAIPAHPVDRADAHGAGDVFVGALAAHLAAGASLADAVRYANAAAALHVGTPEAERERLGPDDVARLLARAGAHAPTETTSEG